MKIESARGRVRPLCAGCELRSSTKRRRRLLFVGDSCSRASAEGSRRDTVGAAKLPAELRRVVVADMRSDFFDAERRTLQKPHRFVEPKGVDVLEKGSAGQPLQLPRQMEP